MKRLQAIERRIDQKIRDILRSSTSDDRRELIEVHRAILEEVESHVETLPRAKSSFSYSHVVVQILASLERRRSYELVFTEADALERDIKNYFNDEQIDYPGNLRFSVALVKDLPSDVKARGFDVRYSSEAAQPEHAKPMEIQLTVLVGSAEPMQFLFSKRRIMLGRMAEVLDAQLRPVRRNDVALSDAPGGPNPTVSRSHAHLEFDDKAGRFRLFDDGSSQGTTVLREGALLPVPKGASKGVALFHDDEIILGQVHLRFEQADSEGVLA